MEKNGLSTESSNALLAYLSLAEQFYDDSEKFSPERRTYSKVLKEATAEFNSALKERDFDRILKLEKIAQRADLRFSQSDASVDMRIQSLTGLYDVTQTWETGKEPEKVRKRFEEALEDVVGYTLGERQIKDTIIGSYVRTQCRRLGVFAGGTANPAEKFYYNKRQECLRELQKEHQKHLDQALGFAQSRQKTIRRGAHQTKPDK